RGRLRFERDPAWLLAHLDALTAQHESHRPKPWAVSDAPPAFVARQLRGLVGFEVAIDELSGVWKVSQNKPDADRAGVEAGLKQAGTPMQAAVSDLVRDRAPQAG
ncbi:MAG: FMN-binding negative transcriptional regulator, partial [Planctomycetota bacterium]